MTKGTNIQGLTIWPHYEVQKLSTMAEVRELFPDDKADSLNWCLLSTSGVHGSYQSLDDVFSDAEEDDLYITVLVIQPRLVILRYGLLKITPEDATFLRGLVATTLEAIPPTQEGNLPSAPVVERSEPKTP